MATEYLEPPPGVHPNYDHPTTLVGWTRAAHILFAVLITVSVFLRQYTRCCIARFPFSADDFFCILSYILSVAFAGISIHSTTVGLGYHAWEIPVVWAPRLIVLIAIGSLAQVVVVGTVKLIFLSVYCHYFWLHTTCRRMVIAGFIIVVLYTMAFVTCITTIMAAVPPPESLQAYVDHPAPVIIQATYNAVDSVINLYILFLPLPCLREFEVNVRSRGKVIALFIGGLCSCIAGIVRATLTTKMVGGLDVPWNESIMGVLTAAEVNIGIICACALLWPAFVEGKGPERIAGCLVAYLRCRPRPRRRAERQVSVSTLPDMLTMELCSAENRGSIGSSPAQGCRDAQR